MSAFIGTAGKIDGAAGVPELLPFGFTVFLYCFNRFYRSVKTLRKIKYQFHYILRTPGNNQKIVRASHPDFRLVEPINFREVSEMVHSMPDARMAIFHHCPRSMLINMGSIH